jgi:hypothetical protein
MIVIENSVSDFIDRCSPNREKYTAPHDGWISVNHRANVECDALADDATHLSAVKFCLEIHRLIKGNRSRSQIRNGSDIYFLWVLVQSILDVVS